MRIMVTTPYASKCESGSNVMREKDVERIMKLVRMLREKGHDVFFFHEAERFGQDMRSPEETTIRDYDEIRKAEIIIASPGKVPSGGVHMELGWASALGKKIILLLKKDGEYSFLINGLNAIANVDTVEFETDDEALEKLDKLV